MREGGREKGLQRATRCAIFCKASLPMHCSSPPPLVEMCRTLQHSNQFLFNHLVQPMKYHACPPHLHVLARHLRGAQLGLEVGHLHHAARRRALLLQQTLLRIWWGVWELDARE